MPKEILFISDLHLTFERPEITRTFINFLTHRATQAEQLYILGDLFDTWIGDDDVMPPIKKIKQHLKKLTQQGTQIFYIHGNRDFLIGQRFSRETGVTLLNEYSIINLYGTPTLLTHGDLLCTDDIAYQNFRIKSHTKTWQANILNKPLIVRILCARWYRLRSFFHKQGKAHQIMDVNQNTVIKVMRHYKTFRLIHGHTHRHKIHHLNIQGQHAQRIVLPEWKKNDCSLLVWTHNGYHMEKI